MAICREYENGIADIWDHMSVLKSFSNGKQNPTIPAKNSQVPGP